MNEDEHSNMQELLREILNNVNTWLTFAEAKNAAIITFDFAMIAFVGNIDFSKENIIIFTILIVVIIVGMIISLGIALLSFMPQVNKNKFEFQNDIENGNLIYYGDIAKYNDIEYIKNLCKQYFGKNIDINEIKKIEIDYSNEIICNAKIACKKYKFFKCSLIITLGAMVFLIFVTIIYYFKIK